MEDSMIVTPQRSGNTQNPLLVPFILLLLILVAGVSYIVGSKNPINILSEATPRATESAVLGSENEEPTATPSATSSATPASKASPTPTGSPFNLDPSLLRTAPPLR